MVPKDTPIDCDDAGRTATISKRKISSESGAPVGSIGDTLLKRSSLKLKHKRARIGPTAAATPPVSDPCTKTPTKPLQCMSNFFSRNATAPASGTNDGSTTHQDNDTARASDDAESSAVQSPAPVDTTSFSASAIAAIAGLGNIGNTCYMNSVLQALRCCAPFVSALASVYTPPREDATAPGAEQACLGARSTSGGVSVGRALWRLFDAMHAAESGPRGADTANPVMRPLELHGAVGRANEMFNNTRQHDAQEFLHLLLDTTHENCKSVLERTAQLHATQKESSSPGLASPNTSPIKSCFEGSILYRTQCHGCECTTERREQFLDITLAVAEGGHSVTSAIRKLCERSERMHGRNKYFCETCNRFTEATRRIVLDNLPPVLILHLNRSSGGARKVNSQVQAPMTLCLTRWQQPTPTPQATPTDAPHDPATATPRKGGGAEPRPRYELVATVMHSGRSSSSGHYTCYTRVPKAPGFGGYHDDNGSTADTGFLSRLAPTVADSARTYDWALCDDDVVRRVSEECVRESLAPFAPSTAASAYMLFYQRTAPRPRGGNLSSYAPAEGTLPSTALHP
eukprot:m.656976 g.656976  ORF g.656976 m.656976 type:complete len:572 (+) comp22709_c0_seq2:273-1988(+)